MATLQSLNPANSCAALYFEEIATESILSPATVGLRYVFISFNFEKLFATYTGSVMRVAEFVTEMMVQNELKSTLDI